jgi:hypothetical protein
MPDTIIGKIFPFRSTKVCREVEVKHHLFFTSALDKGEMSTSRPGLFIPGEKTRYHWIGSWVCHRVGLNVFEKRTIPQNCLDSNTWSPGPYPSHHTDYIIPTLLIICKKLTKERNNASPCETNSVHLNPRTFVTCVLSQLPRHKTQCSFKQLQSQLCLE